MESAPTMNTFSSRSVYAPRVQAPQLDQLQTKRLDLRQHAVQGGTIQNTREERVFPLELGDHRRKGAQRRWAKMARDPNRVQIRHLVHTYMLGTPQVRAHHQDLVSVDLVTACGGKQTKFACAFDGCRTIARIELRVDVAHVRVDGVD